MEILKTLHDTPLPTILVVAGVVFLLLAVAIVGPLRPLHDRQKAATIIGIVLLVLGIALHLLPPLWIQPTEPTQSSTSASSADKECIKDGGATIDGETVPVSAWGEDCSYTSPKNIWGKKIKLTTWGHIIEYDGDRLVKAKVLAPRESITVPGYSSVFAGYQTQEASKKAYSKGKPQAPPIQ